MFAFFAYLFSKSDRKNSNASPVKTEVPVFNESIDNQSSSPINIARQEIDSSSVATCNSIDSSLFNNGYNLNKTLNNDGSEFIEHTHLDNTKLDKVESKEAQTKLNETTMTSSELPITSTETSVKSNGTPAKPNEVPTNSTGISAKLESFYPKCWEYDSFFDPSKSQKVLPPIGYERLKKMKKIKRVTKAQMEISAKDVLYDKVMESDWKSFDLRSPFCPKGTQSWNFALKIEAPELPLFNEEQPKKRGLIQLNAKQMKTMKRRF